MHIFLQLDVILLLLLFKKKIHLLRRLILMYFFSCPFISHACNPAKDGFKGERPGAVAPGPLQI
jgi:hypothetical protein